MNPDTCSPSSSSSVLHLAGIGLLLFSGFGCTTTPEQSTGIVATPVGPSDQKTAGIEESTQPGEASAESEKPKEKPSPAAEEPADASALAAAAKAKFRWSSSQSSLQEAFDLSGRAADLAPKDPGIALQHAEHALRLANTASGIDRPARIAKEALASLDAAGISGSNLDPKSAYYRASLNGLIMQAQGLAAAGKLPELQKLFTQASGSPGIEEGGPLRALGMVYLKAPPWPTGIGDLDLALEYLEKAASSYANFPFNHICLAQAFVEDGNQEQASQSLSRAEDLISSGSWGASGAAWQREIAKIRSSLN